MVTNSFDAEQGQASGAWINVETKSGTNQLHGDLHESYTGNALSALNYFSAPNFRNPLNVFNQFGGSLGGPSKRISSSFSAIGSRPGKCKRPAAAIRRQSPSRD